MSKLFILIVFALLLLTSCEYSNYKTEQGEVIEKQFSPKFDASGTGFSTNGDISYHTMSKDEQYVLVFKCEHQTVFSVNRKELYYSLNKGNRVTITYREVRWPFSNNIIDYDFETASKNR